MKLYKIATDKVVEAGDIISDRNMSRYRLDKVEEGRVYATCIEAGENKDKQANASPSYFECYLEGEKVNDKTRRYIKRRQATKALYEHWKENM